MKFCLPLLRVFLFSSLLVGLPGPLLAQSAIGQNYVFHNQSFVESLYSTIDLEQPDVVFEHIFSSLEDAVRVYPTENYYYWSFYNQGKTIWGNFRLDVLDRDQGVIHLGYFEYDENGIFQDQEGHEKSYSADDGVHVKRANNFLYEVTYKGKTVNFNLNDIGMQPPVVAKIAAEERYVGPVFDESGLKFFLIFDQISKHFFYVLNEDEFLPETFTEYAENLVVGRRTGFAFYQQESMNRKILIAINGRHIERNHYYDGPFDQLPDNYADQTGLQHYIEQAYNYTKGNIDKYGTYLEDTSTRVLINPYYVYYDYSELSFVDECAEYSDASSEFINCITYDPNASVE